MGKGYFERLYESGELGYLEVTAKKESDILVSRLLLPKSLLEVYENVSNEEITVFERDDLVLIDNGEEIGDYIFYDDVKATIIQRMSGVKYDENVYQLENMYEIDYVSPNDFKRDTVFGHQLDKDELDTIKGIITETRELTEDEEYFYHLLEDKYEYEIRQFFKYLRKPYDKKVKEITMNKNKVKEIINKSDLNFKTKCEIIKELNEAYKEYKNNIEV